MTSRVNAYISAWASHHPDGRLTNDELVMKLDTNHEWLDRNIGTRERRIAAPDQSLTDLMEISATGAVERSGGAPGDLDLIIASTNFDDMMVPSAASRLGGRLGSNAYAFDVRAACSGWFLGLDLAISQLTDDRAVNILVSAGELSRVGVDPDDREGVIYFGDASASGIVTSSRPTHGLQVIDSVRSADNSLHHAVEVPTDGWFRTDGPLTRRWVVETAPALGRQVLETHDLSPRDLRAVVFHQANLRMAEELARDLEIDPERHWHNVEWAGNTGSAGAASALFEGLDRHRDDLRDGDLILVATVGAGLNALAFLLRWISDR